MKKRWVLLPLLMIGVVIITYHYKSYYAAVTTYAKEHIFVQKKPDTKHRYYVKSAHKIRGYFNTLEQAIEYGVQYKRSIVVDTQNDTWVWNNYAPFLIFTEHGVQDFDTLESAIYYAKRNSERQIYWGDNKQIIWDEDQQLPQKEILDVPVIQQYPELPRGCEVTSLAMLLQYWDIEADKLELAKEIKKDPTPYSKGVDGKITFGNPYTGFVGDMYSLKNNGHGVYHGPIAELLEKHAPNQMLDITGMDAEKLLFFIANKMPVWVVINSTYKPLDEDAFQIWHTPTGIVKVTYRQHAVVITGYSDKYIYLNDPLYPKKNIQVDKKLFIEAWIQLGSQAVVVYKP